MVSRHEIGMPTHYAIIMEREAFESTMLTNPSEPYDICNGSFAALVVTVLSTHLIISLPTPPQTWGDCRQHQRVRHPARSDVRGVDSLVGLYARFIHSNNSSLRAAGRYLCLDLRLIIFLSPPGKKTEFHYVPTAL